MKNNKLVGRPVERSIIKPEYREITGMAGKYAPSVREPVAMNDITNKVNRK